MHNPSLEAISPHSSVHSEHTPHLAPNQPTNPTTKINQFHHQSPASQINLTAQQHFNNLTNNYSAQNLTYEQSQSNSPSRKSRSLQSPLLETEFSDLDNFLKQTYQKNGIYDLVRSFVDMEDKLVSSFQNLKINQEPRKSASFSAKNNVRCFEDSNQLEKSSDDPELIIWEFLYTLQSFFLPANVLGITQNQKADDFSFSETKPHLERSLIASKLSHIHNSRSKYVIGDVQKSKRAIFSQEQMMKSINIMQSSVTPLKFDDFSLKKIPQSNFKWTDSKIIDEDSLESENMGMKNQMELVKMIFALRKQNFELKKQRRDLNGTYSQNSSFYFEKPKGERNLFSRELENTVRDDSCILEMLEEKQSLKLLNDSAKIKSGEKVILKSSTYPIVIKEDDEQQNLSRLSDENGSFRISMLERIEVEDDPDQQNNPNIGNSQTYLYSKTTPLKFSKDQSQRKRESKLTNQIQQKNAEMALLPQNNSGSSVNDAELQKMERRIKLLEEQQVLKLSGLIDTFLGRFKKMFKVELEIQLILLRLIKKSTFVNSRKMERSFGEIIDWYDSLRVREKRKEESFDKFVGECVNKKMGILDELREIHEKVNDF